jgi:hypothetical protein
MEIEYGHGQLKKPSVHAETNIKLQSLGANREVMPEETPKYFCICKLI